MAPRTPGEGLNVSTVSGPSCRQSCGGRGGPCRMGGVGSKMGHSTVSTPSPRPPPPCCAPPPKVHRRQGVSRMGVDRGAGPQLPALHPVRITQGVPNLRTTLLGGGWKKGRGGRPEGESARVVGHPTPFAPAPPPPGLVPNAQTRGPNAVQNDTLYAGRAGPVRRGPQHLRPRPCRPVAAGSAANDSPVAATYVPRPASTVPPAPKSLPSLGHVCAPPPTPLAAPPPLPLPRCRRSLDAISPRVRQSRSSNADVPRTVAGRGPPPTRPLLMRRAEEWTTHAPTLGALSNPCG